MDSGWICQECGFDNPYTLRVAFQDICIKCKSLKQTIDDIEEQHEMNRSEIENEITDLKSRAGAIQDNIFTLENEISELESEKNQEIENLREIKEEYDELISKRDAHDEKFEKYRNNASQNTRRITIDQKTLVV